MTASGYPWPDEHLREPGVLRWTRHGFEVEPGDADVRGRTPVAAIGANASPRVLSRKLGGLPVGRVPMHPQWLTGVAVGHSAHVSLGGYVPAAPYAAAATAGSVVGWFDDEQLALLDASEPNYRRVHLAQGVDVYASRWEVVAIAGSPIPLTTQARLLARLCPPALKEGAQLIDPATAVAVSAWLQAEHAVPAGLPPA